MNLITKLVQTLKIEIVTSLPAANQPFQFDSIRFGCT